MILQSHHGCYMYIMIHCYVEEFDERYPRLCVTIEML